MKPLSQKEKSMFKTVTSKSCSGDGEYLISNGDYQSLEELVSFLGEPSEDSVWECGCSWERMNLTPTWFIERLEACNEHMGLGFCAEISRQRKIIILK